MAEMQQSSQEGPGQGLASTFNIILMSLFLVLLIFMMFYSIVTLWPGDSDTTAADAKATLASLDSLHQLQRAVLDSTNAPRLDSVFAIQSKALAVDTVQTVGPQSGSYLFWDKLTLNKEMRVLLIVLVAGALGSLFHSIRSFYWYVGHRSLKNSWILMYLFIPFNGAILAVIFYLVIRGGFFPGAEVSDTPFSFAALAALVGMFSEAAVKKLQDIASSIFSEPDEGAESVKAKDSVKGKDPVAEENGEGDNGAENGNVPIPKGDPPILKGDQ